MKATLDAATKQFEKLANEVGRVARSYVRFADALHLMDAASLRAAAKRERHVHRRGLAWRATVRAARRLARQSQARPEPGACKRCGFEAMAYDSCCAACGYDPKEIPPSFDPEVPALFDGPWGSAERGPFARRR